MLGAEDRTAVVAFTGRKLEMLSQWSRDTRHLARALETAKDRPTRGLQREVFLRKAPHGANTRAEAVSRALRLRQRIRDVILGAETAMRSFARAPGRRAMLLLAGGWPQSPVGSGLLGVPDYARHLGYGPYLYRSLYDTANRLSFTSTWSICAGFAAAGRRPSTARPRPPGPLFRTASNGSGASTPLCCSSPSRPAAGRSSPPGAHSVYETALEMRRLRHHVVVSIHDRTVGEMLWTRVEVGPR